MALAHGYGVLRPGLPIGAAAAAAAFSPADVVVRAVIAAVVVGLANAVARWAGERWPWHAPVSSRLQRWEETNNSRRVEAYLASGDWVRAESALRRAQLIPDGGRATAGIAPPGAPQLDRTMFVFEPMIRTTDEDLGQRVARVLSEAGVEVRAGGWNGVPSSSPARFVAAADQ